MYKFLSRLHFTKFMTLIYSTLVCYQGFIVGSITGTCRFYDASGTSLCWVFLLAYVESFILPPPPPFSFFLLECLNCSFDGIGKHLKLDAQIRIQGRKRNSAKKITGIQVCFALIMLSIILAMTHFVNLGHYFLHVVLPGSISKSYDSIRRLQTSYI